MSELVPVCSSAKSAVIYGSDCRLVVVEYLMLDIDNRHGSSTRCNRCSNRGSVTFATSIDLLKGIVSMREACLLDDCHLGEAAETLPMTVSFVQL